MSFLDINFPKSLEYSSDAEPIPLEFYLDVIPESKVIYLKLGYFSSKAIQVLSYGFAQFISNGGMIKVATNHFLYGDDMELVDVTDLATESEINTRFINDLRWMYENLQKDTQHFFDCLKYLVKCGRLEIIPVMLRPGRMAHYKQGIFFDDCDNKIFIDGSCNFTANGLLENGESISVFRSWGDEFEVNKVKAKKPDIEKIIEKQNDKYLYIERDQILDALNEIGRDKSISELLNDELQLIGELDYTDRIKDVLAKHEGKLIEKIEAVESMPKFPFGSEPREYQICAYDNWVENNRQGIFAMATGTGKTITALNCLLNIYLESGVYQAIIVVPSKILLNQWEDEAKSFNFVSTYLVSSEYQWKEDLKALNTSLRFDKQKNFVVIVTYNTFSSDKFQTYTKNFPEETMLIADEAHNMGAEKVSKLLPSIRYSRRLALSATPKRQYDLEGNQVIEKFFNSEEPYTYSFSMERAIREGILCSYEYYPHIVSLNDEEMSEYVDITKELARYFDFKLKQYKKSKRVEMLLLARKRIIHKAENKIPIFREIIEKYKNENKNLKYTFVYAPEGNDKNGVKLIDRYMDEVETLDRFIRIFPYTHHSDNKGEVMRQFEDGHTDILFSMKCLDEGVDIPRAELAIFCSSTGNPRQFIQRRGRILRKHPDKELAVIHDLVVVPQSDLSGEFFSIEKNMIRNELTRVIHFASLAMNYYSAMEKCVSIAEKYELDMYALENELKE